MYLSFRANVPFFTVDVNGTVYHNLAQKAFSQNGYLILNEKEKTLVLPNGKTLKEGDQITIDGNSGEIYLKKVKLTPPETSDTLNTLLNWSNDFCDIGIRANADTIEDARVARSFKIDGVGLCRTEHMFLESSRINLVRQMILSENEIERFHIAYS